MWPTGYVQSTRNSVSSADLREWCKMQVLQFSPPRSTEAGVFHADSHLPPVEDTSPALAGPRSCQPAVFLQVPGAHTAKVPRTCTRHEHHLLQVSPCSASPVGTKDSSRGMESPFRNRFEYMKRGLHL